MGAGHCPCDTSTPTWRSLAMISSGLCLFLVIGPASNGLQAIHRGGPLLRGQTIGALSRLRANLLEMPDGVAVG